MAVARRDMDDFFGDMIKFPKMRDFDSSAPQIKMDLVEQPEQYVVTADVPGLPKEDIHVDIQNNMLTISAEFKKEKKEKNDKFHFVERQTGHASRSIGLPDGTDPLSIKATQENGVLKVIIPKPDKNNQPVHRVSID